MNEQTAWTDAAAPVHATHRTTNARSVSRARAKRGRGFLAAIALGLSLSACSAADDLATDAPILGLRENSHEESDFLLLLNEFRAENGLNGLAATPLLNQVAYDHSLDMGNRQYFDHTNPEGESPFDRMRAAGYRGGFMAENIAAGQQTAQQAFASWRDSPGHRQNMLNPRFKAIGIGRAEVQRSRFGVYWTTVFGDVVDGSVTSTSSAPQ